MATMSPTPAPAAAVVRRTSQRQALRRPPSRQAMNRAESQPAASAAASAKDAQKQYNDDSSEDEIPVPMKLSALTKALLNDDAPGAAQRPTATAPSPPRTRRRAAAAGANTSISSSTEERRQLRSGSVQAQEPERPRKSASPEREPSPARKRVVRLSNTPQSLSQIKPGSKRSSTSLSRATSKPYRPPSRSGSQDEHQRERMPDAQPEVNTPAQSNRVVRIAVGSSGNRSRVGSAGPPSGRFRNADRSAIEKSAIEGDNEHLEEPGSMVRSGAASGFGSISRHPSGSTRSRPDESMNPQSSMRVKRVGKLSGSFLSGPARRARRRQSEEDEDVHHEGEPAASSQGRENHEAGEPVPSSFYGDGKPEFNSGSPVSGGAAAKAIHRRHASTADLQTGSGQPSPKGMAVPLQPSKSQENHQRPASFRPQLPSAHDQENEIPINIKRPQSAAEAVLEKAQKRPLSVDIGQQKPASPDRKPLASIAQNTPHRPAPPPPPKMSVLEAATATAGAATTTQVKQRRNVLKVNGKCYTRLDCLGRGGSSKVYRVTAENGKMLALKRVSLENADEVTVKGFKAEIDLLHKLAGVDRVIQLIDHELNNEKQMLTLVMEMGELDLETLLRSRMSSENAKFDPVLVRFYWKEMLECLQAVHQIDIVHSDLKPANFVLVKGQLKLIDFGIANAIQTDETVNVHREHGVGTPNYMSPESLIDANNPRGARVMPGRPRLMKVGKPSDIWSMGCTLYKMVYGVLPFAHIQTQFARCQAIINWDHAIEFPSRGVGGVQVPASLLRTMKRCLNRETHMRPTCEELLHPTDPFLYPTELVDRALPIDEELLQRIIQSVVTRCRERMPTEAESMSVWPQAYWASIRKAMAARS